MIQYNPGGGDNSFSTDRRLSECFECSSFSNDPEDRYPKRKRVTHPSSFLELTRDEARSNLEETRMQTRF